MKELALLVRHRTLPGKREHVRALWEKHMATAIESHAGHLDYFYCFDVSDPNVICVFQRYASEEAAKGFIHGFAHASYADEVSPLLAEEPQVSRLDLVWIKR